jgi:hypothetical protein
VLAQRLALLEARVRKGEGGGELYSAEAAPASDEETVRN